MTMSDSDIAKMQQTDHDTLIRVETKIENLILEVKQANSDINSRLIDHEGRIRSIEAVHERTDPAGTVQRVDNLDAWKNGLQSNWKLIVILISFISGLVGFVGSWLAILSHIVHLGK